MVRFRSYPKVGPWTRFRSRFGQKAVGPHRDRTVAALLTTQKSSTPASRKLLSMGSSWRSPVRREIAIQPSKTFRPVFSMTCAKAILITRNTSFSSWLVCIHPVAWAIVQNGLFSTSLCYRKRTCTYLSQLRFNVNGAFPPKILDLRCTENNVLRRLLEYAPAYFDLVEFPHGQAKRPLQRASTPKGNTQDTGKKGRRKK